MSELGGLDIGAPDEGIAGAPEELSEEAKQRFAAAAAAMQQIRREEKRSKKRDDQVARTIIQFLGQDQYAHLFVLISRLVARDCPSIFILSILSLIHEGCLKEVEEYVAESGHKSAEETMEESTKLTTTGELDPAMNRAIVAWITRMQLVLSLSPEKILTKLMIDEKNVDGTVLQLATFIVKDFFQSHGRNVAFEKVQPLTASILQSVFEPFIERVQKAFLAEKTSEETDRERESLG
ncbi:hypothetical protein COU76_05535 [Candidatus Peregrinibacteria bacterium CG10_big_fil_rev_8_21_14_0_10_49_10]|nr:MAG: hypothetical protein COU76_05535 [Candidatus Peregrinibacteria bacterium CG10_big_fil_rev_8_21_14_0_10_49_10]